MYFHTMYIDVRKRGAYMKIGDFARKYDMNVTTVRYYVEHALLTPERKNNQYVFNNSCAEDMEKIIRYKSLSFSLEEIELLLFLEKTSKFKDRIVLDIFSSILKNKKEALEQKNQCIKNTIKELTYEIENLPHSCESAKDDVNGIPFTFIPYMYCPICSSPLRLESASLSNNKLTSGDLSCACGYESHIEDGVILCDGYTQSTPFKAFKNIESVVSITEEFGKEYRILIDKAYMWMYHQIPTGDEHRIVMAGPFTFNFLLKYCQEFSRNTTFVIIDPSLKRISKMQKYMKEFDFQTVFIAGTLDKIPVRRECIDIYADDFSSVNCIFTYNKSPYRYISPLIKKKGMVAGIFTDYGKAPKSIMNFKKDHPDFIPANMSLPKIKKNIEENGMKFAESKLIGKTSGREKEFRRQIDNETIPVLGFRAVKK